MASHFFDVEIAKEYGLVESILFQNIAYWVEKNRANGENFFDGTFWTYNSIKAFEQLFPYLSGKKIRGALARLVDAGLIITGNYNKSTYDRTLWYGLTEKGICIFQKENFHFAKRANGDAQKGEPIPDINTDNKPDIKPPPTPSKGKSGYSEEFEIFWKAYPNKKAKGNAYKAWEKARKAKILPELENLLTALEAQKRGADWQKEGGRFIPHPATWLNASRWDDEVTPQGRNSYAPNENGKSRYIRESEQNFDNLPMTEDGFLDWSKV